MSMFDRQQPPTGLISVLQYVTVSCVVLYPSAFRVESTSRKRVPCCFFCLLRPKITEFTAFYWLRSKLCKGFTVNMDNKAFALKSSKIPTKQDLKSS